MAEKEMECYDYNMRTHSKTGERSNSIGLVMSTTDDDYSMMTQELKLILSKSLNKNRWDGA